jgi:L-threonylcarbamoyladenylate synthase
VPEYIRTHCDLVLDGGELPGTPSTVVDLRTFQAEGAWSIAREGAMSVTEVAARLESAP